MDELAVHSSGDPTVREELSTMRVAGNLKRDARLLGNSGAVRRVGDQHAGAGSIDIHASKDRTHVLGVRGVAVGYAEELQTVEINRLLVENVHARIADGREQRARIAKLFVIAFGEKSTERQAKITERRGGTGSVDGGAVEKVSGNDCEFGFLLIDYTNNTRGKTTVADMAKMKIADQSKSAVVPVLGKIVQANCNMLHAWDCGVDQAVKADSQSAAEQDQRGDLIGDGNFQNGRSGVEQPIRNGR